MSYKKVFNPEKIKVTTGYKGQSYSLAAGEAASFPEDVAEWFVTMYPFLEKSEIETITKPIVEDKPKNNKK